MYRFAPVERAQAEVACGECASVLGVMTVSLALGCVFVLLKVALGMKD